MAQERIRCLEKQVEVLQERLEQERQRNTGLMDDLKMAQAKKVHERTVTWWRFWARNRG